MFPYITTHLPKILFSESLFCLNVLATRSWSWLDITLAHLFTTTHRWSIITLTPTPHTHKISHLAIRPTLIIPNNNVQSRKHTPSKTMPTNKGLRKETGRLITKKSSVASSSAAAKRDPAITVPSPPLKERVKQQDSSIFFFTHSAICKSHRTCLLQSNVKYSSFWTSSDKTLVKGGCSETNLCSARWIRQKAPLPAHARCWTCQKRPPPAHFWFRSPQISAQIECKCSQYYNQITHQFCCSRCININLPEELCRCQFRWEGGEDQIIWFRGFRWEWM